MESTGLGEPMKRRQSWFWMMVALTWRFLALWMLLFVGGAATGALGSIEFGVMALLAIAGALLWYFRFSGGRGERAGVRASARA